MGPLSVLMWTVCGLATLWKGVQLAATPRELPRRVVFLVFVALLVVLLHASEPRWLTSVGTPGQVLAQNSAAMVFSGLLLCFFLVLDRAVPRRRRVRRAALVATVTGVVYALSAGALLGLSAPGACRVDCGYDADVTDPGVAFFFGVVNAFLAGAAAVSARMAVRTARHTDRRTAVGLRAAAVGLLAAAVVGAWRVGSVAVRHGGGAVLPAAETVALDVLVAGFIAVVGGMTYPAAATRIAVMRRWWWHLRVFPRLYPLWASLAEAFPDHTLERTPRRLTLNPLQEVSRRCYRRIVECRDGLVRISPLLARRGVADGEGDPDVVAAHLPAALRDLAHHPDAPGCGPIVVIPPAGATLDDEITVLAALSDRLAAGMPAPR